MWTVEPVVSSTVIRGNSINVRAASEMYSSEVVRIEPMSMTTHSIVVKPGNEIRGRWAGWIVWRAAVGMGNESGVDSVCSTCNMSSTLFGFTFQMAHLVMTPERITMVANFSESIAGSMN